MMLTFKQLFVDSFLINHPDVSRIAAVLGLTPVPVDAPAAVYASVTAADDPVLQGKKTLYLTNNRGAFLRKCPGTRHYTCCDYQILHIGTFCTMDCAYCILQSYFHPPVMQYFLNHADMAAELADAFENRRFRRIGTGEFTDSLIWELWTDLVPELVARFAGQSHAILELKSKTTAIDRLLNLQHNRKTILAWSMNTEAVIRENEKGTASLSARLTAAARAEKHGYPVAFHFDPMVIYDGCEADYATVVDRIADAVSPENIVWISIGTFRFMPSLKPVIQSRFPGSGIIYGEFIRGMDDKLRYFKPLRIELYRSFIARLRERLPGVTAYFCMEDDAVWRQTMGFSPEEKGGLPAMLDESAVRVCNLSPAKL